MTFDRILRAARLADHQGSVDIGLCGSRIAAIAPRIAANASNHDASGAREHELEAALVLPGFVNALLRLPDLPDLAARAHELLETASRHGTTRAHLSVPAGPGDPLRLLRELAAVREQWNGRISIALALRLDGALQRYGDTLTGLGEQAARSGADAIEFDLEPHQEQPASLRALVATLAGTAAGHGLGLDLKLDATLPAQQIDTAALALPAVLDALGSLRARPAVRLLHATALAAVHRDELKPLLGRLCELDIALVLCPLETLRRAGRADVANVRRGLPRLRELLDAGVTVRLGSGASSDAAALDPLAMAWLAAYASHMGTPAALERVRTLVAPGDVANGAPADLVVLDAPSFAQAVVDHAQKVLVLTAGQPVHCRASMRTPTRVSARVSTTTATRLMIRRATLARRDGQFDVLIEDGVIRAVAPRLEASVAPTLDAQGRLLVPAFVDAHLHLDKTFVMQGLSLGEQILTVGEAIDTMHRAKLAYTPEDLLARGRSTLTRALRHGTTAIRAQCDVDPIVGLMALEALVTLRREFSGRLDLQIVAFPQEGLAGKPQAIALMQSALKAGADAVGGGPLDPDYRAHIAQVFALAREFGAPVDIHADLPLAGLRPVAEWEAPLIAKLAQQHGLAGRVAIGHFAASSTLRSGELHALAEQLAQAGVSVAALPASEMYRQGLADPVNSRRGVPRVRDLLAAGTNVVFASNNLRDAFVTFGNADMLEQALLCATACQLDDMDVVLDMVTTRAARMMGLPGREGIAPGQQADLVLLDARSAAAAIGDQAEKLVVMRRGRIIGGHWPQCAEASLGNAAPSIEGATHPSHNA